MPSRPACAGERVLLVCSAISGVSNLLEALPDQARAGKQGPALEAIKAKRYTLTMNLGVPAPEADLVEVTRVAEGIALLGEVTPRNRARVLAAGELALTRTQGLTAMRWRPDTTCARFRPRSR